MTQTLRKILAEEGFGASCARPHVMSMSGGQCCDCDRRRFDEWRPATCDVVSIVMRIRETRAPASAGIVFVDRAVLCCATTVRISIGGFVFFGGYETTRKLLMGRQ